MIELMLIAFLSQSRPLLAQVTYEQLLNAARQDEAWLMNGKDYTSARFSKLDQINSGNVTRLSAQWIFQTGISGKHEVTPLVVGGVIYITTPANHGITKKRNPSVSDGKSGWTGAPAMESPR